MMWTRNRRRPAAATASAAVSTSSASSNVAELVQRLADQQPDLGRRSVESAARASRSTWVKSWP